MNAALDHKTLVVSRLLAPDQVESKCRYLLVTESVFVVFKNKKTYLHRFVKFWELFKIHFGICQFNSVWKTNNRNDME